MAARWTCCTLHPACSASDRNARACAGASRPEFAFLQGTHGFAIRRDRPRGSHRVRFLVRVSTFRRLSVSEPYSKRPFSERQTASAASRPARASRQSIDLRPLVFAVPGSRFRDRIAARQAPGASGGPAAEGGP